MDETGVWWVGGGEVCSAKGVMACGVAGRGCWCGRIVVDRFMGGDDGGGVMDWC